MNDIDILEEHIKNLNSFNEISRINKQMTICFNYNGEGIKRITQAISNLISENKELKEKLRNHNIDIVRKQIENLYIPKSKVEETISKFEAIRDLILDIEIETKRPSITYDLKRNDYCLKLLQELLRGE